uniref:START domain-containing protein n=1 Tax=Ditylenchus dipsaci TaxID=166011 RepID=A0A915DR96_9BILA
MLLWSAVTTWRGGCAFKNDFDLDFLQLTSLRVSESKLTIAMVCQTVVEGHAKHLPSNKLKREDVRCKITYVAQVHPGGWVPSFGLRQIYKVEYPKFLKSFTEYVVNKVKEQPLHL